MLPKYPSIIGNIPIASASISMQRKALLKSLKIAFLSIPKFFVPFHQATCLNDAKLNFVQFLQEIAGEQQFEVTYVDIEEKSYNNHFQCLVQLSTLPVAVCQGSGNTKNVAQLSAARNALEYLKIMTKM